MIFLFFLKNLFIYFLSFVQVRLTVGSRYHCLSFVGRALCKSGNFITLCNYLVTDHLRAVHAMRTNIQIKYTSVRNTEYGFMSSFPCGHCAMRKRKFDFNAQLGMRLKNGIKCFVSFLGTAPLPSLWSISMHYFLKAHGKKFVGFLLMSS